MHEIFKKLKAEMGFNFLSLIFYMELNKRLIRGHVKVTGNTFLPPINNFTI